MSDPVLILIPCLSGAPWSLDGMTGFEGLATETFRLNEAHCDIESHADDVLRLASKHTSFVLVGDSFGAQVALAAAARQPSGLVGLVMSGGFAANPVDSRIIKLKARAAGFLPGPLYRHVVLRMHARLLRSRFDAAGEAPWSEAQTRALFRANTSWGGYVRRTAASLSADYRARLKDVRVSTLILTPEDDHRIGPQAAGVLQDGIANAGEVVLKETGHMFRFSHPGTYSKAIRATLSAKALLDPQVA